ncbi:MAG TPA: mucoidy inhibitor MuiA family protein [Pirellulales bacterium]|nr:mucoidy inhibitor MuiA family protein [Pirellulales bacterium]
MQSTEKTSPMVKSSPKRFALALAAGCAGVLVLALLARADDPVPAATVEPTKPAAKNAAEPATRGKIDEVTVYRGQALVTRLVDVPGPAGLREIVVTDLPERIEPGSIYAENADGVEVRSVLYRIRPVERDVRAEVRKLDDDIRATQDQLQTNAEQARVFTQQINYMDKLEQFTAPTASTELTKGVLNAETLKSLTAFQFDQRAAIAEKQLKLTFEARQLNDKLNTLNRQRDQLTSGSARSIREAVVFVQLKGDGGRMRLRYLVDGATWDPSYNVRTDAKHQGVVVEYNASIEQMSGEDWDGVAMTLSTATPSLVAKAPVLEPLTISLHQGIQLQAQGMGGGMAGAKGYFSAKKELDERRQQIEMSRNAVQFNGANTYSGATTINAGTLTLNGSSAQQAAPAAPQQDFDTTLNEVAQESQVLDLVSSAKVERKSKTALPSDTAGVTVSYQLATRTTLPSRSDRQLIQIASLTMKADLYKVAEPVLTSYVYDEASIVNDGKTVLLAGPVSTYVSGQFVGHGDLPTVAIGESFTIGLGIDSSLRAHRELLKKDESIQGGNRLVDFTYQLALENFGSAPATVRLLDRMPSAKESEVKLTLAEPGQQLSDDTRYEQQDRKKGLLRWDVKVPAQSIGPKMFTLDYQMQMEYDKQLSIASLPLTH